MMCAKKNFAMFPVACLIAVTVAFLSGCDSRDVKKGDQKGRLTQPDTRFLSVNCAKLDGYVQLSWNYDGQSDGFQVFRGETLLSEQADANYTDNLYDGKGLSGPGTYEYKVVALKAGQSIDACLCGPVYFGQVVWDYDATALTAMKQNYAHYVLLLEKISAKESGSKTALAIPVYGVPIPAEKPAQTRISVPLEKIFSRDNPWLASASHNPAIAAHVREALAVTDVGLTEILKFMTSEQPNRVYVAYGRVNGPGRIVDISEKRSGPIDFIYRIHRVADR